jgi:hypothetical protein
VLALLPRYDRPVQPAKLLASLLWIGLAQACASGATPSSEPAPRPEPSSTSWTAIAPLAEPLTVHVLYLINGPAWRPELPIGQQDLADHFAYVSRTHAAGLLVANGTLGDEDQHVRGMYILAVDDPAGVDAFVREDPALINGVLQLEPGSVARWTLGFDGLGVPEPELRQLYVVDVEGSALDRARVDELAAAGMLLTGGELDGESPRYRYVLRASSLVAANDVAIQLGGVAARTWKMATRASVAEALARRTNLSP